MIHWVHARQTSDTDAVETESNLLHWKDVDPYGFRSGLEKEPGSALNASGLLAFESLVRGRFEAEMCDDPLTQPVEVPTEVQPFGTTGREHVISNSREAIKSSRIL